MPATSSCIPRTATTTPWDQDNETTWLDWSLAETNSEILRFFRMMIAFRKAHPSIGRSTGWASEVSWHGVGPVPDLAPSSHALAFHLRGGTVRGADLYVMINAYWQNLTFEIQAPRSWRRVVDTALSSPSDIVDVSAAPSLTEARYDGAGRSVIVLIGA